MPARRLLACLVLAISLPLAAAASESRPPMRSITTQGEAQASAPPDLALINAGTQSQAKTAREAMDLNTRAMRAVQAALREAGIEDRHVATSALSLQPVIEYASGGNRPRVTGYSAGHQLTVRVRDLAKLGDVLDRLVSAGANQINGVDLTVADWSKRLDEARAVAVADSRRKAEALVAAAGGRVGRVMQITEQPTHGGPQPVQRGMVAASASEAVPIAGGDQHVRIAVEVVWEIVD